MGFFGKFRKKKEIGHIDDVAGMSPKKGNIKVGEAPLKGHEIKELDFGDSRVEVPDVAGDSGGADSSSGFDAFEISEDTSESADSGEEAGAEGKPATSLALSDATQVAKRYLIVHAQCPNSIMPSRSSKRENGEFYFEFRDRELHQVTVSPEGEVIEWNREKL